MPEPVRLSFSGELDLDWIELREQQSRVLKLLQEQSRVIAEEISERIAEGIGASPPEITIEFTDGSVHWLGSIQWVNDAWQVVEIMSGIGGAIGFIHFVRDGIDAVLRRWFSRALGPQFSLFYIGTRVLLIGGFRENRSNLRMQDRLFGIAALIASIAALIAAIGLFIRLAR